MINQLTRNFMLLAAFALVTACASEEEKQMRRDNAFDISGHYSVTEQSGSDVSMDISIANETGRHDIIATVTRFSPITQREKDLMDSQGISQTKVFNHFSGPMTFGRGYRELFEGGENISDDNGRTSRYSVCTSEYRYDYQYEVYYCLTGVVDRATRSMTGDLSLHWRKTRDKYENGTNVREITSGSDHLRFKTQVSSFFNQYFGMWTGHFYPLTADVDLGSFTSIEIQQNTMATEYLPVPNVKSIRYGADWYQYSEEKSKDSMQQLQKQEYPAIQMTFVGPDKKRLVLFGQIWSLGDFTGSLTYVDENTESDIGTFKFKKN